MIDNKILSTIQHQPLHSNGSRETETQRQDWKPSLLEKKTSMPLTSPTASSDLNTWPSVITLTIKFSHPVLDEHTGMSTVLNMHVEIPPKLSIYLFIYLYFFPSLLASEKMSFCNVAAILFLPFVSGPCTLVCLRLNESAVCLIFVQLTQKPDSLNTVQFLYIQNPHK